ncbi:MAG: glycoside hydrolase family 99-like domain-containing protein [Treponema sp.]|nr:glycoside hydrolase family 99-like domain-containing protein [Treponema sp.]
MSINQYKVQLSNNENSSEWKIIKNIKPNSTVLEFGPAYGRMTEYLKNELNCKVYIIEIDKDAYKSAVKYAVKGICANINDLLWIKELKNIKFDHILFADVLEHLIDPVMILEKSVSLLKDDGSILISIPNIAHSAIIINLIKNNFEYTNSGLLDKTHLRFFTYKSIKKMLEACSLYPVIEDAVCLNPEETEIKCNYNDINGNTEILENRESANVFQYIFKCVKKNYYIENKDSLKVQDLIKNNWNRTCNIYFDTGFGFNKNEQVEIPFYRYKNQFEVKIKISKEIKKIRFDPYEGYACVIKNIKIIANNGKIDHEYSNGKEIDNIIIFDTLDPQIIINLSGLKVNKIRISGTIYRYNNSDIEILSRIKKIFEEYEEYKINNKELISEQEKIITEKNELISIKNNLINECNLILTDRNALLNSRSWRITKPLRSIAKLIRKNKYLFLFAKSIVSLKRYGIKKTKNRISVYLQNKKKNKKTDNYLDDTVYYDCEYQKNIDYSNNKPNVKAIAFYLPQFHRIPENDKWWGKGFTEWTNTKKTEPRFKGHYQPREPHKDFGYYNLTNIESIKKQVKLAKEHGIYGFCFYYYWFSGERLLEKPLDILLENTDININFCLCWANENWTRTWDGMDNEVLMWQGYKENDPEKFINDIKKYIVDKRYIRVDNKPVIIVYNSGKVQNVKEVFIRWRKAAIETGIGEIKIWMCSTFNHNPYNLNIADCVDAEIEFPPHMLFSINFKNIELNGKKAYIFDYIKTIKHVINNIKKEIKKSNYDKLPLYRTCMLAWDNAARKENEWTTFINYSLEIFYEWVYIITKEAKIKYSEDEAFIFINAWNEWAEGTYLEPDKKYGYANINTFSKAIFEIEFDNKKKTNNENEFNKKSIIFAGHDAYQNGAQLLALNIIKQLKDVFKYDVYLILKSGGPLLDNYKDIAKEVICLDKYDENEIINWIETTEADIAICNTVVTGDVLHTLTKCGINCISLIHEMEKIIHHYNCEQKLKYIVDNAVKIIYASEYVKNDNKNMIDIPEEKTVILPQGLYKKNPYINRRNEIRSIVRKKHNIPLDSKIILGVGYGDHRKGLDLFARCMIEVCKYEKTYFIWIGNVEINIENEVNRIINESKYKEYLILTKKWEEDNMMYFSAADIFLLTSREDPFPSVVLEAMYSHLPVIAFEGGGGYVEIINKNNGYIVPMENTKKMSDEIIKILRENNLRYEMGKYSNNLINEKFNFITYLYRLMELFEFNYKKISVIIPNYNYERYLKERIESVLNQTYPVFEIIILDDFSSDNSLQIIDEYKLKYKLRIKVINNKKNSGNVFKQWAKGIKIASGDYIWIAEADDLSEPEFIEKVINKILSEEDIVIGYSQSKIIDENGKLLNDNYLFYTDEIDNKWESDYISEGIEEIEKRFSVKNTIPNASAVIFKNNNLLENINEIEKYNIAGDWLFYINLLKDNKKIAFISDNLNIHRRHTNSVTKKINEKKHYDEICNVQEYVYQLTDNIEYYNKALKYREYIKDYLGIE